MATISRLPNGITLVHDHRPGTGHTVMEVFIRGGAGNDRAEDAGLTTLTQNAMLAGTKTWSRQELSMMIDGRGASFGASTSGDFAAFSIHGLADQGYLFGLLADIVRNPSFDPAEIETERALMIRRITKSQQAPRYNASTMFNQAAYGDQPYSRPPHGTIPAVTGLAREALVARHAEMLASPENIIISVAGDMDEKLVSGLAARLFGDLAPSAAPAGRPAQSFVGGDLRVDNNNNQLNLLFGFPAPSLLDPRRFHHVLLEQALDGGMSSPLFVEVREKRGLVYDVSAKYGVGADGGTFHISAGTGKGNAGELVKTVLDLLADVARNGFSDEDLAQARESLVRKHLASRESSSATSSTQATAVLYRGRIAPVEEFRANIESVTNDDLRAAAAAMLRDGRYALAAFGPLDTLQDPQTIKAMLAERAASLPPVQPSNAPLAEQLSHSFSAAAGRPDRLRHSVLANGMHVVTLERDTGLLACGAWVGAGSDHETPELSGATHMNEHMMFKGTPSFRPGEIDAFIEGDLGGGLNAYTSNDRTAYYFYNLLPEHLERVVDVCGEMVFKANITEEEFDGHTAAGPEGNPVKFKGERDVVIEEIKRYNDNISARKWGLLGRVSYPGHVHGRPVLGTEQSIRAMTSSMLRDYRDGYYAPNNVVFSAAGPIRHDDFVSVIEQKFGHMTPATFPALPSATAVGGVGYEPMESAKICTVGFAVQAVAENHPGHTAFEALGRLLSQGDSSRLMRAMVYDAKLTDNVSIHCDSYRNAGQFVFSFSADSDKVGPGVRTIYRELRRLVRTLDKAELDKTKAQMKMSMVAGLETSDDACDYFAQDVLVHGRAVSVAERLAEVDRLTLADIRRAARVVLRGDPALVAITPPGTDHATLPSYADVLALRDPGPARQKHAAPAP